MNTQKTTSRAGFTLMEIMVVIIVIAVLASVAGPMINGIVDQGKASAAMASMQNIKSALISYNNDLGKFPFSGTDPKATTAYNDADSTALGQSETLNVLVNDSVTGINLGIANDIYKKRWKGPYMDADPGVFMTDQWESKIQYIFYNKQLYLHSLGPDGIDDFVNATKNNYEGDDIVLSITRIK